MYIFLSKRAIPVVLGFILSGCSSVAHYEAVYASTAEKQAGGIKAIRQLQRGQDQNCDINVTHQTPQPYDLTAEIWIAQICNRIQQFTMKFEPQANDQLKITATAYRGG
jgi:hypothetical protein